MKLIVAIVQDEDAGRLVTALMKDGFGVTKLATTGGFLRAGNTTLIVGVDDERIKQCTGIIEHICKSRKQVINPTMATIDSAIGMAAASSFEVIVGGAIVFVLDVEQFAKY